jgi:hypothetical protein
MGNIPTIGWIIIGVMGILVFIIVMTKGVKAGIGNKTVEISGSDGEKQSVDTLGLMYVMSDNCRQIEQRKKERIDSIIPDLSYRFGEISNVSCISLLVESILHGRRRRNGFEKLITHNLFIDYTDKVVQEIIKKITGEFGRIQNCSRLEVEEPKDDIAREIVKSFTLDAIMACRDEYLAKLSMYQQFMPLFKMLGDKRRVDFCEQKIAKHTEKADQLDSLIQSEQGA